MLFNLYMSIYSIYIFVSFILFMVFSQVLKSPLRHVQKVKHTPRCYRHTAYYIKVSSVY